MSLGLLQRFLLIAGVFALAACGGRETLQSSRSGDNMTSQSARQCLAGLKSKSVRFAGLPSKSFDGGCRMIDTITEFEIARTPAGAILRATGVAATQGSYNAQLVLIDSTDGNLVYEFRVSLPDGFNDIGTTRSRTISAATELSAAELAGVRQITVRGARNARSSRR